MTRKTAKADGAKSKREEELKKPRAELSSHQEKFKKELNRQKAGHKETETILARSEKGRVEYFVANR